MVNLEIEEIKREGELLIRSCLIKINGDTVVTPAKTIGTTLNSSSEISIVQSNDSLRYNTFGEVYVNITEDDLRSMLQSNNNADERLSSRLTTKVSKLRQIGALPYILFSVVDSRGLPLNQLPSDDLLALMQNMLWGVQGNAIISMPLVGTLRDSTQYKKLIDSFHQRQIDAIDRKNQPLMAIIPSSYSLIDKELIKKYWNAGCRLFAFDCVNKKFGAYSHIIERIHHTLSQLSKTDEELYILNALNSKLKIGRLESSRINNLIGTGYGFDIHSPNHIRAFGGSGSDIKRFIFNDTNYGFIDVKKLDEKNERDRDEILNTQAFKEIRDDLSQIGEIKPYQLQKICKQHDTEKTINEIQQYHKCIENDKLAGYLAKKDKIKSENSEIKSFRVGKEKRGSAVDKWLQ